MTRAEALRVLGDDWCPIHNREKEWDDIAWAIPFAEKECPDCIWDAKRKRDEAKRVLTMQTEVGTQEKP